MLATDKNKGITLDQHMIDKGRQHLGQYMPVSVYRLFEYTMYDVLEEMYGEEQRNLIFYKAGEQAGREFSRLFIDLKQKFNAFIASLQKQLKDFKIGILRIESVDDDKGRIVLTISEDLDCSGLPMIGKTICCYDEGFICGVLGEYTKNNYDVREIDCWAKGDRVCRFEAKVIK